MDKALIQHFICNIQAFVIIAIVWLVIFNTLDLFNMSVVCMACHL